MQSQVCIFEQNNAENRQSPLVQVIKSTLDEQSYQVYVGPKRKQAIEDVKRLIPEFCIVDLSLPDIDGQFLCKELHRLFPHLPLFILTHQEGERAAQSARALNAQAYITKPFTRKQFKETLDDWLITKKKLHSSFTHLGIKATADSHQITINGKTEHLSQTLHRLLFFFLKNMNFVISRQVILEQVWETTTKEPSKTRVVDVYIGYLRDKIHDPDGKILQTIKGQGYILRLSPKQKYQDRFTKKNYRSRKQKTTKLN